MGHTQVVMPNCCQRLPLRHWLVIIDSLTSAVLLVTCVSNSLGTMASTYARDLFTILHRSAFAHVVIPMHMHMFVHSTLGDQSSCHIRRMNAPCQPFAPHAFPAAMTPRHRPCGVVSHIGLPVVLQMSKITLLTTWLAVCSCSWNSGKTDEPSAEETHRQRIKV